MNEDISFSCQIRLDKGISPIRDQYHKTFEIYLLLKGDCWYFIDKKSHRLSAGDIALIPAGVIHGTSYETPTSSRIVISCPESFLPESARDVILQTPHFLRDESCEEALHQIFYTILEEYEKQDKHWLEMVRAKTAELFLIIARASRNKPQPKPEGAVIEKAAEYIRQHYMDAITLQAVAKHCFVSREHLSRIFKKETGFGFNEYINVFRMQKANFLLTEDPHRRVAQVAAQCGFNDSNYFSKQYKKHFGIAPTKTKKN